jgi:hypothetical protein
VSPPAFRLAFAQSLDAVTFLVFYLFIGAGTYSEQNPIILAMMAVGGVWLVAAAKMGTALMVALRYDRVHPRARWWRPTTVIFLSVAAASGIVGAGFNVASILASVL